MIEFALTFVLFVSVLVAICEFGLAFRSHLTASNAAQQVARRLVALGDDPSADQAAVGAARRALAVVPRSEIVAVVVYDPGTPARRLDGAQLERCVAHSVAGLCNRYGPGDLSAPGSRFGCAPTSLDVAFCPTGRHTSLRHGVGSIGVHVRLRHTSATGLLGTVGVDADVMMALEARTTA